MALEVVLMRGISGSGKSTYIRNNFPTYEVCSADDYFMKEGRYVFYPQLLGKAHATCLKRFMFLIEGGVTSIVVDNTNTTVLEMAPYMAIAAAFERKARIITLYTDIAVANHRNVHGVSLSTNEQQLKKILEADKQMPSWWVQEKA